MRPVLDLQRTPDVQMSFVDKAAEIEALSADYVIILRYLCEELAASRADDQAEPLVLEGILIMLHGVLPSVTKSTEFHDIIWSVLISYNTSFI